MSKKWDSKPAGQKGNVHSVTLNYVYDNTLPDSKLRKAICDICVWGMDISKFDEEKSEFPKEFLEDFALQQMRRARLVVLALGPKILPFLSDQYLFQT
jgi:hypothetical protein